MAGARDRYARTRADESAADALRRRVQLSLQFQHAWETLSAALADVDADTPGTLSHALCSTIVETPSRELASEPALTDVALLRKRAWHALSGALRRKRAASYAYRDRLSASYVEP